MRIFLCSPYAGNVEANVALARRLCAEILAQGHSPFAPHLLYPQVLDDADHEARERGIRAGLEWLRMCDEVWCWREVSPGMVREVAYAIDFPTTHNLGRVCFPWGVAPTDGCPVCLDLWTDTCPRCAALEVTR